jgi:kynureninase
MNLPSHYSRFRVSERLLLTGHSHQAWPDVAFEAQQQAWLDAAALVDDKWERAAEVAARVQRGWLRLLNDPDGDVALGQNTHELLIRLLSALPLDVCPRLVTTDGEFHTIRRQLDRLAETSLEVVKVRARPVETLAERLADAVDDRTASVLVSSVLFETAEIVPGLDAVADACARHGAELLVDAYHHINVVPFDAGALGLSRAFIVGGGYKYCQLGEGNCFLRVPPGCELRPVLTGWFSEFARLAERRTPSDVSGEARSAKAEVPYGEGAARFAGSTYDPTAHYRAAAVFDFHERLSLVPERLRDVSLHQVGLLERSFRALNIDPAVAHVVDIPAQQRAGFLAIRTPHASALVTSLRKRGALSDARGEYLRLGPAPYLSDTQLRDVIALVAEVLKSV